MFAYKTDELNTSNGHFVAGNLLATARRKNVGNVAGEALAELDGISDQLESLSQELGRVSDRCVQGQVDINVSSAVCLVRLNLDVRKIADHVRKLTSNTRERCNQADNLAERLEDLKAGCVHYP